ncbi:HTH-type transcriptional regulator HdfR [Methylobacterium crusticola]|uniref:HTH-type transcriptional regulator HdfR n=1 Tax=Methylobacterium crusticola TaxID=1697972 RepID=A0ABQ4R4M4_9HYPH|nr:LysR substrate-binding domain-containing protein [Methylobacterium crusticola]GJD51786.1 HTH-type transcriptional regulator HdfR [Methylobacterium crusticola]
MDLARLRTLRELAVRGTMAAVAEALLVSPSAVSQQIALLEGEMGTALVERRGRGVVLTLAGARLAEHAGAVIAILEEARTDLAAMRREVAGELRVAAFPSVAASLIPHAIRSASARYPALRISFEELEPAEGLAALRAWQADIAIVDDLTTAGPADGRIELAHLLDDTLHVMLPRGHPLAARPFVGLGDLRGEPFALDNASRDYAAVVVRACREAGFEPVVNGRCEGFEVVRALTAAGCSISVQPGLRATGDDAEIRFRELRPAMTRCISAAYRRGEARHPAVGAFLAALNDVVGAARREERLPTPGPPGPATAPTASGR